MAEIQIFDMATNANPDDGDFFEQDIVDQTLPAGRNNKKISFASVADFIAKTHAFTSDLTTTSKNLVGAINEVKHIADIIPQFSVEVVQVLPTQDISETTIYMVPSQDPQTGNAYDEYIYVNNNWEFIGSTAVDLSAYYTSAEVDTLLAAKANTSSLATVATAGNIGSLTDVTVTTPEAGECLQYDGSKWKNADIMAVTETEERSPYVYRQTPSGQYTVKEQLIGGSVVWNQLVDTNTESVTIPSGHKYISKINSVWSVAISDGTAISVDGSRQDMVIDLTATFGTTIANYIYTLEQNTSGSGVAWFRKYFDKSYYGYATPHIESTKVSGKKVVGFNQWDEQTELGSYDASGNPTSSTTLLRSKSTDYINVFPNTEYYVKVGSDIDCIMYFYDSGKNFIQSISRKNTTFTTPSNAIYMRFRMGSTYGTTYNKDICINISSSRNGEYEPYKSTTYDLSGSHLVKRKYALVTFDGSADENWSYTNSSFRIARPSDINSGSTADTLCNQFTRTTSSTQTDDGYFFIGGTNLVFYKSTITSVDAWKTYLASNPVQLIYTLSTPTTETVTNPTLYGIWKLDENNNLYFDGDTVDDIPNPQIVENGGTEEFIDAEVTAGNRDVSMPVGGGHKYGNNPLIGKLLKYMQT